MAKQSSSIGRPTVLDKDTVRKLEEAFRLDATVTEACSYAGISRQTYYEHYREKPEFSDKIQRARLYPMMLAKSVVLNAMEKGDAKIAFKWLERRERDRYGLNANPQADDEPETPLSQRTLDLIKKYQDPPSSTDK